jgi:predicted negative regulator of RcsB-dependent stress response
MRDDLEQQEQLAAIKGFWNDNKKWILPLLLVLAVGAASFNGWTWWKDRQAVQASEALFAMEGALEQQDLEKARVAYRVLTESYSSTAQAALAGLQMAKAYVAAGDVAQAREALGLVVKKSPEEFSWIAKVRLAGVLLDENNPQAALESLAGKPPKLLAALVNDRKGDVHAALGQKEEARSAWKLAADEFSAQSPSKELVLRKLQTLDSFKETK